MSDIQELEFIIIVSLIVHPYEPRRQAAVLVLKELAVNSPTLFYVHVSSFVELIWVALRDTKVNHFEFSLET